MIISKKHLPRRTFLRGMGVTLALPFLDSMVPAQTPLAKSAANPKLRLGFVYLPHGAVMDKWTPVGEGSNFQISPTLTPLAPYQDQLVVVSGLAHRNAESLGDGSADHARSPATWLNGVHPKKTEGEDVRAGTTIDQIAAKQIGQSTPLPSLEVATEDFTELIGSCDSGYSCVYLNTISWSSPTSPLPMEINPRVVFERLFGEGGTAAEQAARMREDRSILDSVSRQTNHLKSTLGTRDRARVDQYLEDIREVERRIQNAESKASSSGELPEAPIGVPDSFDEHIKILFDLGALAYQADITRVFNFMVFREVSQKTYPWIGVPEPHHATSHHQDDPVKIAKLVKIQTYHAGTFARFLEKLRAAKEGEGTVLDNTMILYGGCMSNSNVHNHSPLPLLLAGGAAGKLQGNRHLKYPENTPMSNLLLNILDKAGIEQDKIGDSTGPLAGV